jgi:hypothetical protein
VAEIAATGSLGIEPAPRWENRTIFKIEMSDAENVILIAKRDANAVGLAEHVTRQRMVAIESKGIGAVRR